MEHPDDSTGAKHGSSNNNKQMKNSDLQLLFPPISERIKETTTVRMVRSVPCILNLEKSGKFTIYIDDGSCNQSTPQATNAIESSSESQSTNSINKLTDQRTISSSLCSPLRGEWYLTPNPYCVTDRSYDTLTLIAKPRIRRAHCEGGIITELARIELRCKLWGRYGVGAVRNKLGLKHGREMGRISHGTVLVVREYENENISNGDSKKVTKREIIASFAGRGLLASNDVDVSCKGELHEADELDAENDLEYDDLGDEF